MALILKFKTQINIDADRLFITDLTGEYNDPDNIGGYGDINPNLYEHCLLAIIQRNYSVGVQDLAPVGYQFIYDHTSSNDKSNIFEFEYLSDGWHSMHLLLLPVSQNQNTDIIGNPLNIGDNFFYTATNRIHIRTGEDASDEVTKISTVLDQGSLQKSLCEDVFLGLLSIAREEQYNDYRRTKSGVCEPNVKFNAIRGLTEDIISADLTFRSGLKTQAQDQVEVLLDEQNI